MLGRSTSLALRPRHICGPGWKGGDTARSLGNHLSGKPSYQDPQSNRLYTLPMWFASAPRGVIAIGVFLVFGSAMALLAGITLVRPGTILDCVWALNPHAYSQLSPARQSRWGLVPATFRCTRYSWRGLASPKKMGVGFSRSHNLNPSLGRLSERLAWTGPSGLHRCPISWRSPSVHDSAPGTRCFHKTEIDCRPTKGVRASANDEDSRVHNCSDGI